MQVHQNDGSDITTWTHVNAEFQHFNLDVYHPGNFNLNERFHIKHSIVFNNNHNLTPLI